MEATKGGEYSKVKYIDFCIGSVKFELLCHDIQVKMSCWPLMYGSKVRKRGLAWKIILGNRLHVDYFRGHRNRIICLRRNFGVRREEDV